MTMHEFDFAQEWERFQDNKTATTRRYIRFGGESSPIECQNDVDVNQLEGLKITDGKNSISLVCGSSELSSTIFSVRTGNLHRSGVLCAGPFIGAVPSGTISPKLANLLSRGAIDRVTVFTTAFVKAANDTKGQVVQASEFFSCTFTYFDWWTYPFLTIFKFSYLKLQLTQQDYHAKADDSNGHGLVAKISYNFDFNAGSGGMS